MLGSEMKGWDWPGEDEEGPLQPMRGGNRENKGRKFDVEKLEARAEIL